MIYGRRRLLLHEIPVLYLLCLAISPTFIQVGRSSFKASSKLHQALRAPSLESIRLLQYQWTP